MGKQWEQWQTLFLGAPKSLQMVTAAMKLKDPCSLEKSYDQTRQHIKKQRHYSANKGPSIKAMVFPVVTYGCESWTIKKAEHWRIDAFELWYWRKLLSPLDCKEIQPVHPKGNLNIHWKNCCWSWNSNTLATWCEELTHLKRPWCWKRLRIGREGDDRGWDGWMASPIQWTCIWVNSGSWWWTGRPGMLQYIVAKSQTWLNNWTELMLSIIHYFHSCIK